ncbi:hypothetical protein KQ304_08820 [Synechococcus sp. CS-1329]|uniref:hypothetical protein n=1 Tax=Synechococcus sp. CS-1329 TaxID=2847975 RepID=UPI00223B957D|nr:hypothetical protein [Synechococcus sp. CS-1329]MCT0219098.1 hypothetical protein [Synechococcus sp. CS-1329]
MTGPARNALMASLLAIPLGLAACSPAAKQISLKGYGPLEIQAGQPFNVQPDGLSAIWADTTDAPKSAVPVLAGQKLPGSSVNSDGTLVSGLVPPELYAKPGSYPLYIVDEKTGKKSNEVMLIVK